MKINVPAEHQQFAASYRYGYRHAVARASQEKRSFFKTEEAWTAYRVGYSAGLDYLTHGATRRHEHQIEEERAATIHGPLFAKARK